MSAVVAAGMVGIASIGNALGRVFWAWVSDTITRRVTFVVMFLMQVVLFWILPGLASAGLLTVIAFIILMCYGGGFGTMPASRRRLLRLEERRADLRADADGVGLRQRLRAAADRPHAGGERQLPRRASRHRRSDAGVYRASPHHVATQAGWRPRANPSAGTK